jgi:hypothetical protein
VTEEALAEEDTAEAGPGLAAETEAEEAPAEEETAAMVMPLSESDTRDTAPNVEPEQNERTNEQGRELKDLLLALFLLLLVAEMGVSRYVG